MRDFYLPKGKEGAVLREDQKKSLNRFCRKKGSTKQHDGLRNRQKYWCPEKNIWYVATPAHKICKECNGSHKIIKFDRKIHAL